MKLYYKQKDIEKRRDAGQIEEKGTGKANKNV